MSKKIIGIIIIGLALLLLVGIIYGFFIKPDFFMGFFKKGESVIIDKNISPEKKASSEKEPGFVNTEKKVKEVKVINEENIPEIIKETKEIGSSLKSDKDNLMRVSASFAERFGSYSNQSNYSNLNNLMIFMSAKMKDWAENFIKESKINKESSDVYYGIITKAVKEDVLNYDEDSGEAEILVNTRRKEASASGGDQSDSFSQNIIILFIKERGEWKVNSAQWQ